MSATAKDTFVLFAGNLGSAFWGFLFMLFAARSLSVYEFGILSAVLNFATILVSLADIGISSGVVNYVSIHTARGEEKEADEYTKAAFIIRLLIVLGISAIVAIFAPFISKTFLASMDPKMAIWAAVIPIFIFPDMFFPFVLQAKKRFLHSTVIDNAFYLARLLFALAFYVVGGLTMSVVFWAFGAGFIVSVILIMIFVGGDFLKTKPGKERYMGLFKYSGWIGLNRIVSSVTGRLDIQMLASMSGAVATGLYSIPSRLVGFLTVLVSSFSSVLAPRFASFGSKDAEKKYMLKSLLAVLPLAGGVIIWIIIAEPFILTLFGEKYRESVPVFQALAAATIPYLFTVPSVTAIIYSMKKTVYIGIYSFVHLALVFSLNLIFIPKFGVFGPPLTLGISYTILAIYTWVIVIRYYWGHENG